MPNGDIDIEGIFFISLVNILLLFFESIPISSNSYDDSLPTCLAYFLAATFRIPPPMHTIFYVDYVNIIEWIQFFSSTLGFFKKLWLILPSLLAILVLVPFYIPSINTIPLQTTLSDPYWWLGSIFFKFFSPDTIGWCSYWFSWFDLFLSSFFLTQLVDPPEHLMFITYFKLNNILSFCSHIH